MTLPDVLPNYPGTKGSNGVDKRLVSLMRPHRVYIEGFVGGGGVLRLKASASLNIGLDLDPRVIQAWEPYATPGVTLAAALAGRGVARPGNGPVYCFAQADFVNLVASPPAVLLQPDTLLYLDPPYLLETRTQLLYLCEMHDPLRHEYMLSLLVGLPCMVMISHYPHKIYSDALKDWRCIEYTANTRGGPKPECCWLNFPEAEVLHDARFAGDGFRERERIKKKRKRWVRMLSQMLPGERQIIADALAECAGTVTPPAAIADRHGELS